MNSISRLKNVEDHLDSTRIDAVLLVDLANIRYLCGFTGSSGVLAFVNGEWSFFTDGRYTEQARQEVRGARIKVGSRSALVDGAEWIASKLKRRKDRSRIAIEAEHTTLAMVEKLKAELEQSIAKSKYRLLPIGGVIEQFRMRKDRDEIMLIRNAISLASNIFPNVINTIRPNTTENEVAAELDHLARQAGAERMSFETIVASGSRSALPHARPTQEKIGRGFVVLDYGVILGGYCSDMTRTVRVGPADASAKDIYSAVLEAQMAGIQAVRAGVEAQQVDRAARNVLRKHKLDKYFTHSLGHGVGIQIHEAPRLAKGQTLKLESGMVVTIEPGVYIPGKGGVRIEDMVLVTQMGCEVLTPTSKELVVVQ